MGGSLVVRWFEELCVGDLGRGEWDWDEKGKRSDGWSGVVW